MDSRSMNASRIDCAASYPDRILERETEERSWVLLDFLRLKALGQGWFWTVYKLANNLVKCFP